MLNAFPKVARWEQAEDVLQNAMLRLLRALEATRPDSTRSFFNLAAEAIRRELLDLLDRYRCDKRGMEAHHDSRFHKMSDDPADTGNLAMDPADPNEEQQALERWAEFHEAVGELPPQEAEVFRLIFYNGLTQLEVATLRDMSEKTVQRRWKSACDRLRERFGGAMPLE
jgi:RNA polymerase sigma-70 factor (ECF subfamily)